MSARLSVALSGAAILLAGCMPGEMGPVAAVPPETDASRGGGAAGPRSATGGDLRVTGRRRPHAAGDRRHQVPPCAAAQRGRLSDRRGAGHHRHRYHGPFLYLVEGDGKATRYGIAVGREGFGWTGTGTIVRSAKWPRWTPPPEMIERDPHLEKWKDGQPGGVTNPLGARALYINIGGRDFRLPHPRHQHAVEHRLGGLVRLLPDAEPGRHRPLRPGSHGRQGHRPLTSPARSASPSPSVRSVNDPRATPKHTYRIPTDSIPIPYRGIPP